MFPRTYPQRLYDDRKHISALREGDMDDLYFLYMKYENMTINQFRKMSVKITSWKDSPDRDMLSCINSPIEDDSIEFGKLTGSDKDYDQYMRVLFGHIPAWRLVDVQLCSLGRGVYFEYLKFDKNGNGTGHMSISVHYPPAFDFIVTIEDEVNPKETYEVHVGDNNGTRYRYCEDGIPKYRSEIRYGYHITYERITEEI